MFEHTHARLVNHAADRYRVKPPLLEYTEYFVLAPALGHEQHAFLRLAEHDLVCGHAGFALRNVIQLDLDANTAAGAHLARRAGEARRTHVLDADHSAGLHGFKTSLEQKLFEERIPNLNIRPLLLRSFLKLRAGHGRAMNAVTTCLCAHVNDRIPVSSGFGVKDLVLTHQT